MKKWFTSLSVIEQVYFWLAVVATVFLVVQIVLMLCSSIGDTDIDGDGDIEVDGDSGVSIFTTKSITAFFAVGGWTGLLICSLTSDKLQWLSVPISAIAGAAAMVVVVFAVRGILKLQCNGAVQNDKLIGLTATVYVSVPPSRSGRGKVTLNAQGRYLEFDAMTDDHDRLAVDESVNIVAFENDCLIVKKSVAIDAEVAADTEASTKPEVPTGADVATKPEVSTVAEVSADPDEKTSNKGEI